MKLSVVIPAYNEEKNIKNAVESIFKSLNDKKIDHEILVVNDSSTDNTERILKQTELSIPSLNTIKNKAPNGFGHAIRCGLEHYSGDCVAIMMADMSDSPDDLVMFYTIMKNEQIDCVFGSRFIKGGKVDGYPMIKLFINRVANNIVRICFGIRYNDCTNAFKLYRRETIDGLKPFLSPHFNLTLELPLKAIVRGYSYKVLPNSWQNRKFGNSNLKIREMGSRYFFILLYCLIERFFAKGDFKKKW